MARVYEDSPNMDDEIDWISDASDHVLDEETLSLYLSIESLSKILRKET